MLLFKPLPWEYAVRNLFRRPLRTVLTLGVLTTVVLLVFVVVAFVRGLSESLAASGDPRVAIVYSLGMGENLEYSAIPGRTADLVAASVQGIRQRSGKRYVSPELYLGTQVGWPDALEPSMGLVRGVIPAALLVRRLVEIEEGGWPGPGEVLVGRMVAPKLGLPRDRLGVGSTLAFEGRSWRVSGVFSASGSVFEAEVWCRLDELQVAMKRQDLSLVAVTLAPGADIADVDLFCKERLDLELQAIGEADYYARLQADYRPVRLLAWLVVVLVSGAGFFSGLNTMYAAALGRTAELATLQTLGFVRRAIVLSLVQEGVLLAAGASLIATLAAMALFNHVAVRFTMGAFTLRVDGASVLMGCSIGLLLGLIGAIPPAIRALRIPIVEGLKIV